MDAPVFWRNTRIFYILFIPAFLFEYHRTSYCCWTFLLFSYRTSALSFVQLSGRGHYADCPRDAYLWLARCHRSFADWACVRRATFCWCPLFVRRRAHTSSTRIPPRRPLRFFLRDTDPHRSIPLPPPQTLGFLDVQSLLKLGFNKDCYSPAVEVSLQR